MIAFTIALAFAVCFLFWRQRTLSRQLDSLRADHKWARKDTKKRLNVLGHLTCTCEACVSIRNVVRKVMFPDPTMEAACLKSHQEGRSRPLQEFIDETAKGPDW